jgi:hypothetical protein
MIPADVERIRMRLPNDRDALDAAYHSIRETFRGATFAAFEDLTRVSGMSFSELIAHKSGIEHRFRATNPDLRLTSRMDLSPAGWHLGE